MSQTPPIPFTLTFAFPDQQHLDNAIGALSRRWGYQAQITDPHNIKAKIPNPQSATDFVKAKLLQYLSREVVEQLASEQAATARATATTAAQAIADQVTLA